VSFEIFEQFQANIHRFLVSKVGGDDGQDLLSQVRLSFQERMPQLRDKSQIKPFLFQIARDELKKHWLSQYRMVLDKDTGNIEDSGTNPETQFLEQERVALLHGCIKALPDLTLRRVAELRYQHGQPHIIIRKHLNLSVDQVKKYIKKAEIGITDCVHAKLKVS